MTTEQFNEWMRDKHFIKGPDGTTWIKAGSQAQSPEPKQVVCHEPVAKKERKESHSGRFLVSIKSFRSRLLDPDNLCPKYFIDSLKYAGLIPDDRAQDIELVVSQEKSKDQRTEIVITKL